jgi:hypothetical protein
MITVTVLELGRGATTDGLYDWCSLELLIFWYGALFPVVGMINSILHEVMFDSWATCTGLT